MIENILDFFSHPLTIWVGIISVYLSQKDGKDSRPYEKKEGALESDEKIRKHGSQIKLLNGKVESQGHALKVMDKNLAETQAFHSDRQEEIREHFMEKLQRLDVEMHELRVSLTKGMMKKKEIKYFSERVDEISQRSIHSESENKRLFDYLEALDERIDERIKEIKWTINFLWNEGLEEKSAKRD